MAPNEIVGDNPRTARLEPSTLGLCGRRMRARRGRDGGIFLQGRRAPRAHPEVDRREDYGPSELASVDQSLIFFLDRPGLEESVSRLTGEYSRLTQSIGRVELNQGTCSAQPFTPFPPRQARE